MLKWSICFKMEFLITVAKQWRNCYGCSCYIKLHLTCYVQPIMPTLDMLHIVLCCWCCLCNLFIICVFWIVWIFFPHAVNGIQREEKKSHFQSILIMCLCWEECCTMRLQIPLCLFTPAHFFLLTWTIEALHKNAALYLLLLENKYSKPVILLNNSLSLHGILVQMGEWYCSWR